MWAARMRSHEIGETGDGGAFAFGFNTAGARVVCRRVGINVVCRILCAAATGCCWLLPAAAVATELLCCRCRYPRTVLELVLAVLVVLVSGPYSYGKGEVTCVWDWGDSGVDVG